MELCPSDSIINFDIAQTSGFYSQLTGVLAGFSFTALIFLIGMRVDGRSKQPNGAVGYGDALAPAYMALLASFIGLVLSSLGYAVLAGAKVSAGRAATEEGVLGAGFALSATLLIYAIVLTLDGAEHVSSVPSKERQHVARMARNALAAFVAPVATFYIILGNDDYLRSRHGPDHGATLLEWYSLTLIVIQLVVSWLLFPLWFQRREPWSDERKSQVVYRLSWGFLILSFASAIALGFIENVSDLCNTLHPAIPTIATTTVFTAMVTMTWLLAKTRPLWPEPEGPANMTSAPESADDHR